MSKEFEKWNKEWVCDIPICPCEECDKCRMLLRRGWEAALKWVFNLSDSGVMIDHHGMNSIAKELEEWYNA